MMEKKFLPSLIDAFSDFASGFSKTRAAIFFDIPVTDVGTLPACGADVSSETRQLFSLTRQFD